MRLLLVKVIPSLRHGFRKKPFCSNVIDTNNFNVRSLCYGQLVTQKSEQN